jgi:hypothetical protein
MSKFVNVPLGNYQVSVQSGGRITLDTGVNIGDVIVTGNLTVQGTQTTLNTTDTDIEDRIIRLNTGDETGAGINPGFPNRFSGVEIERGTFPDVFLGFDEDIDWINPGAREGAFVLKDENDNLIGLRTNSITTGSGDLYLISAGSPTTDGLGNSTGGPIVTVTGVTDYEKGVFQYDNTGALTGTILAPDALPNAQAVSDWVDYNFANVFLQQIGDGDITPSSIVVADEESSGIDSVITFTIDSNVISRVYKDRWEFDEVRLEGTKLETISSNEDLILSAPGVGSIRIDDTLHINSVPSVDDITLEPIAPDDGAKIYVADEYTGKTGIYFVNKQDTRDELVSKNRSLLFSMLF